MKSKTLLKVEIEREFETDCGGDWVKILHLTVFSIVMENELVCLTQFSGSKTGADD